jgi:hypothetical protein
MSSYSITGTYVVQGDCTGTLSLFFNNATSPETFPFEIVDGGQGAIMTFVTPKEAIDGRIYRAASRGASQCGNTSIAGNYGFLLSGLITLGGTEYWYSNAGLLAPNGSGGVTTSGFANVGAGGSLISGTGTYSIASDCSGTAQLINAYGVSNYNVAVVGGGTVLFMATDAGSTYGGAAQPQLIQSVLPQFAFGGSSAAGFYSALYFTNTTNATVSFPVNFTADNGTPLSVPALGGASTTVNVPALGTAIVEAPNSGPLTQGYATFAMPPGVSGYGVFRQSVSGRADQEAVVPFATANSVSSTLVWDDTAFTTSVAMVNAGPVAATISITVWDNNGNVVGTSSVTLPPYQKTETANGLRSLPGLSGMAGSRGRVQFAAASGNVAVLGLRFGASAFTSIPATQP